MLTTCYCLPSGKASAEAAVIPRPEIFEMENSPTSAPKREVSALLCALLIAALLSLSWEARWASAEEVQGVAPTTYQQDASHKDMQGHIRHFSTVRKRHPRFRKARTHHRLRARRALTKVAGRHRAPATYRHARHLRHGRYYARKGPPSRVSSAASGRARSRKPRILATQETKPPLSRFFIVGRPDATPPSEGEAPAAGVPEQAPAAAELPPGIAVSGDGTISANIKNRPLGEMLRLLSEKHLFEIRGPLPGKALSMPVSMEFSALTLDEVFDKMMRGYNYAFIRDDVSERRVLMVLGEIKRVASQEPVRPAQPPVQAEQPPQPSTGGSPAASTPQPGGGTPEGATVVPPRPRVANLPQRGRPITEGPTPPAGQAQPVETPQAPAQEQKAPDQQGLARPGAVTEPGAAAAPPKPEGEPAVPEGRPAEQPTLGSF
ncbi:MAG TPA: hypothetical protein VLW86_12965 [Syntrophorhabdales bacterium]|nr:hypothetical protein [Syntrophorhabdales bacterium]